MRRRGYLLDVCATSGEGLSEAENRGKDGAVSGEDAPLPVHAGGVGAGA